MDVPLLPLLSPPPGQSHPSIKPHCAPEHQRFPSQDTNFPEGPWAHIPPPAPWGDPTGPLPPSSPPQHMGLDGTDGAAGSWGTQGHQGTFSGWGGKRGAVAPLLCKGHPLFWGWSLQQRRGVRVAYGTESPKPLGVTLQGGGCACVPPSVGDRCFNICLGWQLLLSQEEAAVPSRKRMMMRKTAGQSNLEAPSIGAMAGEYPGVGGWPWLCIRDLLHREGHHSSRLYPRHPGALPYPQQPAL